MVGFLMDHIKTRERLFASFYGETNRKNKKEQKQENGQSQTLTNLIVKLVQTAILNATVMRRN